MFDKISELSINPLYIFCSDKSRKLFGISKSSNNTSAFPSYFYPIDKYIGINVDVFYSPLIKDDDDELIFIDTSMDWGETYYYWVKARDSWGSSAYSKYDTGECLDF
mgnify:CR=1 FL=1